MSLSIFGHTIDPHYWVSLQMSPRQIIAHYFRNAPVNSMNHKELFAANFEVLKRMNLALPEPEDTKILKPITLSREGMTFQVPCFQEKKMPPPPRFSINGDPFWLFQRSCTLPSFVWKEEFVWMRDCSAQSALSTCTTSVTAKIEVSLTTQPLRVTKEKSTFEYKVTIRNTGEPGVDPSCQILSRHWYFLDWLSAELVEVTGSGVVGEFPLVHPGQEYSYTSGTEIGSRHGVMKGLFQVARFHMANDSVEPNVAPRPSAKARKAAKGNKQASKTSEDTGNSDLKFIDTIDVFVAPTLLRS